MLRQFPGLRHEAARVLLSSPLTHHRSKSALAAVPLLAGQHLIVVNDLTSDNFSPWSEKSVPQTMITVTSVNNPPQAVDDSAEVTEDSAVLIHQRSFQTGW